MNVTMAEERREVVIAEKMMMAKNYVGAREKLLKALQSSPPTDNANQMMIVCDILAAASIKFPNFGVDYYWVLQLSPMCSHSDVHYRYQKLVKALQPSRYKIHGASLAGKVIKDAFSVLSNQSQRGVYDLKRADTREGFRLFSVPTSVYYGRSDLIVQPSVQGSSSSRTDVLESEIDNQAPSQVSDNMSSKESVEADINKSADVSNALDSDPSHTSKSLDDCCNQDFFDFEKAKQNEIFEVGQIWASSNQTEVLNGCRYARIDNISNTVSSLFVTWLKPTPISSGERLWCEAGLPVGCGSFEVDSGMRGLESWPMALAYKSSLESGMMDDHYEIYPKKGEVWAVYKDWDLDRMADAPDEVKHSGFDLIEMLSDFSKYLGVDGAYLAKVDNFKNIYERKLNEDDRAVIHVHPKDLFMFSHRVSSYKFEGGEIEGVVSGMLELDHSALIYEIPESDQKQEELEEEDSKCVSFTHTEVPTPMNAYSEFQCLSPIWTPYDFSCGQVWAVFCSEDYMPRKYVIIEAVISENQVSVAFLDPLWVVDEFILNPANVAVFGIYKVSESWKIVDMSQFSHLVKCQKSTNNPIYKIYPGKGEIWAMYENWTPSWKQSDYYSSQYEVVEILHDYSEWFTIAKLREVKGCLTFFSRQKHDGFNLTGVIWTAELPRFSHQIPAYKVPGIGAYGIPEESWHLDPSALPPKA